MLRRSRKIYVFCPALDFWVRNTSFCRRLWPFANCQLLPFLTPEARNELAQVVPRRALRAEGKDKAWVSGKCGAARCSEPEGRHSLAPSLRARRATQPSPDRKVGVAE
jgi:hypothetical protein